MSEKVYKIKESSINELFNIIEFILALAAGLLLMSLATIEGLSQTARPLYIIAGILSWCFGALVIIMNEVKNER